MHVRKSHLGYIIFVLTLVMAIITIGSRLYLQEITERVINEIQQVSIGINAQKASKLAASDVITQTKINDLESQIQTEQTQLNQLNNDLSAKQKELDASSAQLKAQQDQLSSSSSQLTRLKSSSGQQPLFN